MKLSLIVSALLAVSATLFAGETHDRHAAAAAPSKDFDLIKSLAGDWKGTAVMEGKTEEIKTSFHVSSMGSAVVETMAAGTPNEMTNVYHVVGGKLMMTHYCAMGNAPLLTPTKSDAKSVTMEAVAANGIDPKKTPHMHAVTFTMADKDHLTASWRASNMGAGDEKPSVFNYERVH